MHDDFASTICRWFKSNQSQIRSRWFISKSRETINKKKVQFFRYISVTIKIFKLTLEMILKRVPEQKTLKIQTKKSKV